MKYSRLAIISFVLMFCLSSQAFALPSDLWNGDERIESLYSKETAVPQKTDMLQELLIYIGIFDKAEFNAAAEVKREDLIKAFSFVLNIEDVEAAAKGLFEAGILKSSETEGYAEFYDLVYAAAALTGYADSNFSEGEVVSKASRAGLLYNISYSNARSPVMAELAQLVYNALSVPAVVPEKLSSNDIWFTEGAPLLKSWFDIELLKGTVTGISGFALYSGEELLNDMIEIDRVRYALANPADGEELIGRVCRYFIKVEDETVLFAEPIERKNTVTEIKPYMLEITEEDRILYTDDSSKQKKAAIDRDARIIYNGVYIGTYNKALMDKYTDSSAEITIVENSSEPQLILVWQYTTYPVKYSVSESGYMTLKDGYMHNGRSYIDLSDKNTVLTIIKNGEVIQREEIKAGDVAAVAQSINSVGDIVMRIIISDNKKTMQLSSIRDDEYCFEENAYNVSGTLKDYLENKASYEERIVIGQTYTITLNHLEEVADIGVGKSLRYGFIVSMSNNDKGFSEDVSIKIFDEDSSIKLLEMKEKIKLFDAANPNGEVLKEQEAYNYICGLNPEDPRFIVQYKTNAAGELDELYLPVDNTANRPGAMDYPMTLDYRTDSTVFYFEHVLAYKYRATADLPIFVVPDATYANNETYYSIRKPNYKGNGVSLPAMEIYGVNEYYIPGAALMRENSVTLDEYETVYIVDKIAKGIDSDGNDCIKIYAWQGGNYEALTTTDGSLEGASQSGWYSGVSLSELRCGDVIQANTTGGEVSIFKILFRPSDAGEYRCMYNNGNTFVWGENMHRLELFYGRFVGMKENMMTIDTSNTEGIGEFSTHYIYSDTAVKFYLVDTENDKIKVIDRTELVEGDRIVLHNRYTRVWSAYIYR